MAPASNRAKRSPIGHFFNRLLFALRSVANIRSYSGVQGYTKENRLPCIL